MGEEVPPTAQRPGLPLDLELDLGGPAAEEATALGGASPPSGPEVFSISTPTGPRSRAHFIGTPRSGSRLSTGEDEVQSILSAIWAEGQAAWTSAGERPLAQPLSGPSSRSTTSESLRTAAALLVPPKLPLLVPMPGGGARPVAGSPCTTGAASTRASSGRSTPEGPERHNPVLRTDSRASGRASLEQAAPGPAKRAALEELVAANEDLLEQVLWLGKLPVEEDDPEDREYGTNVEFEAPGGWPCTRCFRDEPTGRAASPRSVLRFCSQPAAHSREATLLKASARSRTGEAL